MRRSRAGMSIPNNLFVTGGSGGGVLTAWIVGKTDRFRAAATQKPVIDWASFALTTDVAAYFSPYWFAKKPWEDPRAIGAFAAQPRRQRQDADARRGRQRGLPHARTAKPSNIMPRSSCAACRQRWSRYPARATAASPSRPSQAAAKASAILAWFDRYRTGKARQPSRRTKGLPSRRALTSRRLRPFAWDRPSCGQPRPCTDWGET